MAAPNYTSQDYSGALYYDPNTPGPNPINQVTIPSTGPITRTPYYNDTPATTPAPDPNAGKIAAAGVQKDNIFNTANEAATTGGNTLHSSILDFLDSVKSGQQNIDNEAVQNELAKRQGTQGVLGMVGRGIQSAGVTLANRNAGDSSATEAFSRAYGDLGRRQLSDVGSQYALGNDKIQQEQGNLADSITSGTRKITDSKNTIVNNIVSDARSQFAALDAQIAQASLPQRIQIEQEKEKVRQSVLGTLQQYDQELSSGVSGVTPMSQDARLAKVNALASAGTAPDNAFSFTSQAPAELQGTGANNFSLPIYTNPRNKQLA